MRLPLALDLHRARPFVGRADLLSSLTARLEGGEVQAVFVDGAAGSGKTALVAEMVALASAEACRVLYGACDQGYARPYEALLRALRSDSELFGRVLELRIQGLGVVVSELAEPSAWLEFASVEERQLAAANAMVQAFRELTSDERLFVVVDDLQWAPPATIALMRHVVRSWVGGRLTLIGTMRTSEVVQNPALADLLADLRVEPGVARVRTEPFTRDDVELLASAYVHAEELDLDPSSFAEEVWIRSGGNALFAVELLRCTSGDSEAALPDTISTSVEHRLAQLPSGAADVLDAVAVAGSVANQSLIAAVCGDDERTAEVLDALVNGDWLRDERGTFRFAHDVTREAIIERMPSARRLRLHARIGTHLRTRDDRALAAAAWHLHRAVPYVSAEDAVSAAMEFCGTTIARETPEEAEAVLADALEVLDAVSVPTRCDVLLAMGYAKGWLSDLQPAYDFALAAAETALGIGDPDRLAAAVTTACHGQLAWSDDRVPAMVERSLPLLEDPVAIARLRSAHAFYEVWAADRGIDALPVAEEAILWARRANDHAALTESLYAFGLGLQGSTRVAERRKVGEELLALAADDDEIRFRGLRLAAPAALELGDRAGYEQHRLALHTVVQRSGSWLHRGYADLFDAGSAFLDGDLATAESRASQALVDARGANFIDLYAGALFVIRRHQGRLDELGLLVETPPDSLQSGAWMAARMIAAIDLGDLSVVRSSLAQLKSMPVPTNLTRPIVVAAFAEAAWTLRDHDAADRIRLDLLARTGTVITLPGAGAVLGAADRYIAMLYALDGDTGAASEAFDRAELVERTIGAEHIMADTLRHRAAALADSRTRQPD